MFRRRPLHVLLAALLVLLHALAPAVHALQHGCGHAHGDAAPTVRRADGVARAPAAAAVDGTRSEAIRADEDGDDEHCAFCELLRGDRSFEAPAAPPCCRVERLALGVVPLVDAPPRSGPIAAAHRARAPPALLV